MVYLYIDIYIYNNVCSGKSVGDRGGVYWANV